MAKKFCKYCKTYVNESDFKNHIINKCIKRAIVCNVCGYLINVGMYQDHLKFEKIKCEKCNYQIRECNYKEHITYECKELLISCEYCKILIKNKDYKKHVSEKCTERFSKCRYCLNKILFKDLEKHIKSCKEYYSHLNSKHRKGKLGASNPSKMLSNTIRGEKVYIIPTGLPTLGKKK